MLRLPWRYTAFALKFARSLLLLAALPLVAAGKPAPVPPRTADAVTHHRLVLDGRTLAYTARAGTITLRNTAEQPTARIFYTAYTLDGAERSKRAVTFLYNGGPGSSTMWLRMGSFGPVRVVTADGTLTGPPPYRVIDNAYSLLDRTDLVFIDMPGSGFGRFVGSGDRKDFWGVDQDAAAFGQFIERYIGEFDRWNSPRFLFGESYGTMRSAVLAKYLQDHGIGLNGVVLLSSFLNASIDYNDGSPVGGGDWAYILYLPTEAATAWYHHVIPRTRSLKAVLSDVETFGLGEYLDALAQGAQLSPNRFDAIVAKLHAFTGLSENYIRRSNLRIPYDRFQNELLRERGITVGRIDSRFQTYVLDRPGVSPDWDAFDAAVDSAFTSTVNTYLRQTLRYDPPLLYRSAIYDLIYADGETWDFKHGNNVQTLNVTPDLAQAMTYNPQLRIFSANGVYDFATPFFATVYALNHLYLAPALQRNISYGFYDCGHMVYLHPESLARFRADLERWYARVLARA
ncbi:MAG: peptidase S10 [Candidatus Eremiobacteraeota bacterium]|nr:peptidase S10 [Candidatus Eremiobacteraeota bacterium]MBV9055331.1 peptidase S10 [Candidatus Eremiobacteraeota bacterium]MBV9701011.1 peptidase S10 [Candidatus Eremiobacteraeota bacterium]